MIDEVKEKWMIEYELLEQMLDMLYPLGNRSWLLNQYYDLVVRFHARHGAKLQRYKASKRE